MCAASEITGAIAFAALLVCMGVGLVHESRFVSHVQKYHPDIWREMVHRGKSFVVEDGSHAYAATQWHLILLGKYKEISDARLQTIGFRTRLLAGLASVLVLVLVGYALVVQSFPPLTCLVSWL